MTEKSTEPVSRTVLSGVLTAIILAILGFIWRFLPTLWQWLVHLAALIRAHLTSHAALPVWSVYILGAALAGWIVVFAINLWPRAKANLEPKFTDYREDRFFGVTWRWHYDRNKRMTDAWPFCPACDTILAYSTQKDWSGFAHGAPKTEFVCETCNTTRLEQHGYRHDIINKVYRQIERTVRNEEWREKVLHSDKATSK
ncbi:hypothetical protein P3T23_004541 [Paraburkholderia sp. GAS448]|uniref:hypothetical protein n=1 Tax=Paraburkholderia sp. GAS448 TaxID=3035136 RepID=UPI003D2251F7